MDKIRTLLDKYGSCWEKDNDLEIPHIVYKQKASDNETVISHNFVVRYSDLVGRKLLVTERLEKDFYDFERRYFSKYFFREDTDLKWNYYLLIIVDESESADSNICQLEQDDKYLRKLVMMEDEFEVYIGHGKNIEDDSGQMISGMDTYAEWQQKLSAVGLEGILTYSYESIRVQNYIEKNVPIRLQGRPIQNWHNTGKGNSKFLIKKIEDLNTHGFRTHCLTDHMKIPLTKVNLISGCNGTGKSSICSAIEYALTGEIQDSKAESGCAVVTIRNQENACEDLFSSKETKEKKRLDQLWYGTVTTSRNSSLNRNFHIFNYLGLEASGKYMQELDIYELVKNVLFGLEVTDAELKMQRYGRAFADKKKEYNKRLKEILSEMDGIQVNYDIKNFSVEDIGSEFKRLGYKGEIVLKDGGIDRILSNYWKILLESNQYVEMMQLKCDKDETGITIMEKSEKLNENRKISRTIVAKQEQLRQDIQKLQQKSKDNSQLLKKIYEKSNTVKMLIQLGEGMENTFLCKQDFLSLKNEYEQNRNIKNELLNWIDQYERAIYSEGNEIELCKEIETKETILRGLGNEIEELAQQIEFQKKQNDNIDTIIQEILSLAGQYIELHKNTKNCPVCGNNFSSKEKLMSAINQQKQLRVIDETFLQTLLQQKVEKERILEKEKETMKFLKEEKEKVIQKRIAISKLKRVMVIDETKSGKDIKRNVTAYIEQLQINLEYNINKYEYAQKVLETDEFVNYSEQLEWSIYLKKLLQDLDGQKTETELLLKEQALKEKELEQEYNNTMEEKNPYSEQEWGEYQLKAKGFQALKKSWEINDHIPVASWIHMYNGFRHTVQYAEEMYGKQEAMKLRKGQIERLQEEKRIIEEWIQRCQMVCEVIETQKHLEDVMKEFLMKNAKQIELFFKLLHRPKEFGKLSISNGNIHFMRNSNEQLVESGQMSTGQRMALAFSVMITLHTRAANAPNFLMLDEPVANLDDMHVLNLIDLLRELAIGGTQIIITTADSHMAKFLRRKFSFLKEEYSHFELSRKGDAQTLIDVVHYVPDMKAVKSVQHLH